MHIRARILAVILSGTAWQVIASPAALECTVMADAGTGKVLVREGECGQRITSGSTFKIAISLMGYDSGILRDEHTPMLAFRKGDIDWDPTWRVPTAPDNWMKDSVVWYSHRITTQLGAPRFQRYVESFNYGNQDVSGDPGKRNGLHYSWISSSLKISPDEQVAFLIKMVNRKLSVSEKAIDMTSRILKLQTADNGWEIYGKPGTGSPVLPEGSHANPYNYGWFIGWARKGDRTVVFARVIQDKKEETVRAGLRVRDAYLRELPNLLPALVEKSI